MSVYHRPHFIDITVNQKDQPYDCDGKKIRPRPFREWTRGGYGLKEIHYRCTIVKYGKTDAGDLWLRFFDWHPHAKYRLGPKRPYIYDFVGSRDDLPMSKQPDRDVFISADDLPYTADGQRCVPHQTIVEVEDGLQILNPHVKDTPGSDPDYRQCFSEYWPKTFPPTAATRESSVWRGFEYTDND